MRLKDLIVIRRPLLSPTVPTRRARVRPWQPAWYLEVLQQWLNRALVSNPETICPFCHSENIAAEDDEQVQAASYGWRLLATRYRCIRCGHTWEQRPLFFEDHLM